MQIVLLLALFCFATATNHTIVCSTQSPCTDQHFVHPRWPVVCADDHACDGLFLQCAPGYCVVDVHGAVERLRIDAGEANTFQLTCKGGDCDAHVVCPDAPGSTCACKQCNASTTLECFHGGSYCDPSGATVVPRWTFNDVWCQTPPVFDTRLPWNMVPAYCASSKYVPYPCRTYYSRRSFSYAPNQYCAAFNFSVHHSGHQRQVIELAACAKINRSQAVVDFLLPTCVEYAAGNPTNHTMSKGNTSSSHDRTVERYFDLMLLLDYLKTYWWIAVVAVLLLCCICVCGGCGKKVKCGEGTGCCVEILMHRCGYGELYEQMEEVCGWVGCCCGGNDDVEEEDPLPSSRRITRQATQDLVDELSRRGRPHHVNIEIMERDVPVKVDSPVRRRVYI